MAGNEVAERLTVPRVHHPAPLIDGSLPCTCLVEREKPAVTVALIRSPSIPLAPCLSDLISQNALSIFDGPCCGEFQMQQLADSKLVAHQRPSSSLLSFLHQGLKQPRFGLLASPKAKTSPVCLIIMYNIKLNKMKYF